MNPLYALRDLGGAARFTDILDQGVTKSALRRARAAGLVLRPHPGTYALPSTPPALALAAAYRADLSCISLCDARGLPLASSPELVHLLVPRDRALRNDDRRPRDRIVLHRDDALWNTAKFDPLGAALDLSSACVDAVAQVALVDSALNQHLIHPDVLADFVYSGAERREWLQSRIDGGAQAITESYTRVALLDAGYKVRSQRKVAESMYVDLVVNECVIIELDGEKYHLNRNAFRTDRARDRISLRRGYATLRYTYWDIFGDNPADLLGDVAAAIKLVNGEFRRS